MKHYILLMEEKRMLKGTYSTLAYIKDAFGNAIPAFTNSIQNIVEAIKALEDEGFKSIDKLTVEEMFLNEVGCMTVLFFNVESNFSHALVFNCSVDYDLSVKTGIVLF